MCFTIEVHLTRKAIERRFNVGTTGLYDFDFHYFYRAFSHPLIPVIPQQDPDNAHMMRWGLVPSWTRDRENAEKIRRSTYNARSESLHEKPSFRGPFRSGRCLVIAHGFFEWQEVNGTRVPWYIRLKNDQPFVFAGLYDRWRDPVEGTLLETFSIITTAANPMLEKIHNTRKRMPVILPAELEREWISGEIPTDRVRDLLAPMDQELLHAHTVSPSLSVGDTRPGDEALIRPYDHFAPGKLF